MSPIRRLIRNLTIPATAFLTAFGILLTYPGGISAAYSDICNFDSTSHQLAEDQATGSNLSIRTQAIAERINLKEALISELIDGRTNLREVSGRFLELNQDVPACMNAIRAKYPELSDDERITMNVIDFVRVRDLSPEKQTEVRTRIAEEYQQMYGHRHQILQ